MARISVIVPVYKVELYIHRCVDSILAQTFTDFELILVDDGSPDNCGMICDEYAAKDTRVHVIHQQNGGLSAARNAGIDWSFANSKSEWLTFVDSDDWIHSRYLECLIQAAENGNAEIAGCTFEEVSLYQKDKALTRNNVEVMTPETLYVERQIMAISACAKVFLKTLFEQARFPVGKIAEDAFITYKIVFSAERFAVVSDALYYYYSNPESIMRSSWNPKRMEEIQAREEQVDFFFETEYIEAQKRAIRAYIGRLITQIRLVENSEWSQSRYEKALHSKLRKALIKYRKYYGFYGNEWAYDVAFPRFMNVYWLLCAMKRKLSKREK